MTKEEVMKWAEERKLTKNDIEFYDYVLGTPDKECFFCKEVKKLRAKIRKRKDREAYERSVREAESSERNAWVRLHSGREHVVS